MFVVNEEVGKALIALAVGGAMSVLMLIGHLVIERQERAAKAKRDKTMRRPPLRRGWDD